MKHDRSILCLLLFAALLKGCGGGNGGASQSPANDDSQNMPDVIVELENSGAIPLLERESTMTGIDDNGNGIRDDIDNYIVLNYEGILQQSAARQSAAALQTSLVIDLGDLNRVKATAIDIARADNCLYSTFNLESGSKAPGLVSQELEAITMNTKARLLQYLAFGKALDGSSWALPTGDTCE